MHPLLNIAVKAARRAGSIINRAALEGAFEVRAKNRNDFVTQVDRAAEQAQNKGITQVIFDRSGARYHGKVKALAEAAREAGLKF